MNLSFNWLKQYVNLPDSIAPDEVSDKLKMSTVEVEKVLRQGENLENVVVGKVLTAEKHPNADKLKVCKVDIGNEQVTIVCGGSNVSEGMLAAVAKNGAKVKWHGEGELVELKPATIRGVESNGMICGADEIGLVDVFPKKDEKEIVDLSTFSFKPGTLLAAALGLNDAILEIDNKSLSNRPDLWGHYGMAREVAVLTNREVGKYEVKDIPEGKDLKIKVEIEDSKLCPRYMAVAVSGITVGPSPSWLTHKLMAAGLRPINNIVDITNYVMLDLGQPMHAFDWNEVKSKKSDTKATIAVRRAQEGTTFKTLDEVERELTSDMLVIANESEPVALAGVMGGMQSGISSATTTIVFESANFDASNIRKTSTRLGLRTDSSARFEKSLDPNMAATALAKAVELVLELCPGAAVASKVVDEKNFRLPVGPLEIPTGYFAQKIGMEISVKTAVSILERLGFEIKEKKSSLLVKIPTWRATKDISIAEDIVEEVVRIIGYDTVPSTLPAFSITPPEKNPLRALEWQVADTLVRDLDYTEVYNYSFVSGHQIAAVEDSAEIYLELNNPLSKEKPYLRRYLLLNLLENVQNNIADRDRLKIFEIGKVYRAELPGLRAESNGDELLPKQDTYLTSVYVEKKNSTPFFEARRVVETVSDRVGLALEITAPNSEHASRHPANGRHPSRTADVICGEAFVGALYELHPMMSARFGIEERVGVVQLNLSKLAELEKVAASHGGYRALPQYPEVRRDMAFIVKKGVAHKDIYDALRQVDMVIKAAELFDVYWGKGVGEGYKSMAYRLTYSHPEKTLTTAEIDEIGRKVAEMLKTRFDAEVRS